PSARARPAGRQITFPGRPVDLALAEGGKVLVVKNMSALLFIDVASARLTQTLHLNPGGESSPGFTLSAVLKKPISDTGKAGHPYPTGFSVVGLAVRGDRVFASDSRSHVRQARRLPSGRYEWAEDVAVLPPKVGGFAFPAGLAFGGKDELWVASSRGNSAQLLDLAAAQAQQAVPVGVAPYAV